MGVVGGAMSLALAACGSVGPDTEEALPDQAAASEEEPVASVQEELLANCPSPNVNVCGSLAGPSGACCHCNGKYGTWSKNPPPFNTYSCSCKNACAIASASNWEGMCCTCNGVAGTFRRGTGPVYYCSP
jgi:hypothetical protein